MKRSVVLWSIMSLSIALLGQSSYVCNPINSTGPLSERLANYTFDIIFDEATHSVKGTEVIEWTNNSPDTVNELHLYMYLNAFKNTKSSYIAGSGMNVMGQSLRGRKAEDWGRVDVLSAQQENIDLEMKYIQPDDQNENDETVLAIKLVKPVLPDGVINLDLNFYSKLPRTIARSGYGYNDFNHFVHWYPKMGVYEQDINGTWGWNCHQFLRQMEFYGDHGNYDVTVEHAQKFEIGGSGCIDRYKESLPSDPERVVTRFIAHDVIDFGWVASPLLTVYEDQWEHVEIRLLSPKDHASLVPRLIKAAKSSLAYFDKHVGAYPYNTLTMLDPPVHGLRSGFMEYPTYITGGSFYAFPKGIRSLESLMIHEFSHQYFMQILANNEKEDPWLDEGFVTFYEDCVMEDTYGKWSLFDLFGYRVGNSSFTRNEYASLSNPRTSAIAVKGWEVKGDYKGIIYSKTATFLQTLKKYLGEDHFDEMMKRYFEQHKFTHPRKHDFVSIVKEEFERHPNILTPVIDQFLKDALEDTKVCDYSVRQIGSNPINEDNSKEEDDGDNKSMDSKKSAYQSFAILERKGDLILPVEVRLTWADGSITEEVWDGQETLYTIIQQSEYKLTSVEIDPDRKLFMDIDFNNNSFTLKPENAGILKYAMRSIYWVQNAIQSASFLM